MKVSLHIDCNMLEYCHIAMPFSGGRMAQWHVHGRTHPPPLLFSSHSSSTVKLCPWKDPHIPEAFHTCKLKAGTTMVWGINDAFRYWYKRQWFSNRFQTLSVSTYHKTVTSAFLWRWINSLMQVFNDLVPRFPFFSHDQAFTIFICILSSNAGFFTTSTSQSHFPSKSNELPQFPISDFRRLHNFNDLSLSCSQELSWIQSKVSKKYAIFFGNFLKTGGGDGGARYSQSQNFIKGIYQVILVCQNHTEVLKYVLQKGGWYLINLIT